HSLFYVYCHLRHEGDWRACVQDLAEQGYGTWIDEDGQEYPNPVPKDWKKEAKTAATAPSPSGSRGESQAQALLRLADVATLFHDPAGRTYAAVPIDGHVEVHEITSTGFRRWLKRLFYMEEDRPPAAQTLQDALGILDARAMHDGPEEEVFVRVAGRG